MKMLSVTLRRRSPWEMDSHIMKADTRCWTGPASPQWGRNTKVFMPRSRLKWFSIVMLAYM